MATTNLPRESSSFVGREQEVAELLALLDNPACRLLTLVGPGGIGKTRLAIEVAKHMLEDFSDGVWIAYLQPISSVDLLVSTIAEAVGFSFRGSDAPGQQLLRYLSDKHMLLVLDNFEQLLTDEAISLIVRMLETAPLVKLLVTSREVLNLQAETLYKVPGLAVPKPEHYDDAESYSAIQLFMARARKVSQGFSLADHQNCVVRICKMVEGMPLALEMAASWLHALPCVDIAGRIERGLLDTRLRDVEGRHRSMRAVFEQSWALLDDNGRHVYQALSVFAGGFRREAAEAVTGADPVTLAVLVNKSLVQMDASGRYEIHELLRQYAQEKLDETPELRDEALDQHCDYYARFLHERAHGFRVEQSPQVMQELEEEIGNLRASWNRAIERRKFEQIHAAMWCLAEFYDYRGRYHEGAEAFRRAVDVLRTDQPQGARGVALGFALTEHGSFLQHVGEAKAAEQRMIQGVSVLRTLAARPELAHSVSLLSTLYYEISDYPKSEALFRESVALATEIKDYVTVGFGLLYVSLIVALLGDYQESIRIKHEALTYFRLVDHRLGMAVITATLGDMAMVLGDYEQAKRHFQKAYNAFLELNNPWHMVASYDRLGNIATALGDFEKAMPLLQEGQRIAIEMDGLRGSRGPVVRIGDIYCLLGEFEQARQYYQEALVAARNAAKPIQEAVSLYGLANVAYFTADYAEAHRLFHQSLDVCRAIGWQWGISKTLNGLATVAVRTGNEAEARQCFLDALQIGIEIGVPPMILATLAGIADLLAMQGDETQAVELLSLVLHHRASHAETCQVAGRLLSDIQPRLSSDDFASAQQRGMHTDLEAVAKQWLTRLASPQAGRLTSALYEPLTKTERHVLTLMQSDLSYPEIAALCHVSLNTIKTHRRHIFNKLDAHSRDEAIQKGKDLGLL